MTCRLRFFVIATAIILFHVCQTGPVNAKENALKIIEEMQQQYSSLTSLSADFSQQIFLPGRPGNKKGGGKAFFLRPSFMRWAYSEPEEQLFINDGSFVTIYQKKQQQMILAPVESMDQDLTHLLFSGMSPLTETFMIQSSSGAAMPFLKAGVFHIVQLTPKKTHNQVRVLYLAIGEDRLIHAIRMIDHFETITDIQFTNTTINPLDVSTPQKRRRLIMKLFSFTPPEGTEIIQQ